jgi:hypothetical protein
LTRLRPPAKLKTMFHTPWWVLRARVAFLLLASLCIGTVAQPHADGVDDPACRPVLISHDESAHYIGATASSEEPEGQHCFLCHSLRSFSPVLEKYQQRDAHRRVERLRAANAPFGGRVERSLASGRAPPI